MPEENEVTNYNMAVKLNISPATISRGLIERMWIVRMTASFKTGCDDVMTLPATFPSFTPSRL